MSFDRGEGPRSEALWERHLATGATELTIAHATAARPAVTARVTDYHEDRYLELDRSGWLAVAEHVADRASGPRDYPTLRNRGLSRTASSPPLRFWRPAPDPRFLMPRFT